MTKELIVWVPLKDKPKPWVLKRLQDVARLHGVGLIIAPSLGHDTVVCKMRAGGRGEQASLDVESEYSSCIAKQHTQSATI